MKRVEAALTHVTMYRLVTITLTILAAIALLLSLIGQLEPTIFEPVAMVVTFAVLLGTSVGVDALIGRLLGIAVHLESAIITGLLLWFLYWPTTDAGTLLWLAAIAALAQLSKFVVAVRRRHLINPAAAGVVISLLIGWAASDAGVPMTSWWIANSSLVWFVAPGALLVLWRSGRLALGMVFIVLAGTWTVRPLTDLDLTVGQALEFAWASSPIVFFAGFMLSEPLTLPPRKGQKIVVAVLAALVFTWPLTTTALTGAALTFHPFESTYELALVVTGLFAFGCGQRATSLELLERRSLGADYSEYTYRAGRAISFKAGQYAEIHVPHRADRRGQRRMFSFVGVPGETVTFAMREPEPGSSFKRALRRAERVRLTSIHGDFVLPKDSSIPLLLVAGGIGITPFVAQLRAVAGQGRDVALVHGVRDLDVVPYRDDIERLGVQVHVVAEDELTVDTVTRLVPDAADRRAYISGSPAMVTALGPALQRIVKQLRIDSFLGY